MAQTANYKFRAIAMTKHKVSHITRCLMNLIRLNSSGKMKAVRISLMYPGCHLSHGAALPIIR